MHSLEATSIRKVWSEPKGLLCGAWNKPISLLRTVFSPVMIKKQSSRLTSCDGCCPGGKKRRRAGKASCGPTAKSWLSVQRILVGA